MKINIVIPCYNEQEVLPKTLEVLGNLVAKIKAETGAETNCYWWMTAVETLPGNSSEKGQKNIRT